MTGGVISGNLAASGGGVYVSSGTFTKTGGTIYGYANESNANRNRVMQGVNSNDKGHAVWVNQNRRKETTAGPGVNLSSGSSVGWDN